MNLRTVLDQEILGRVERPSRYLGCEVNTVHKQDLPVDLRLALVFPDLYDLGLGNLGLHILYAILNGLPWCWAERVYAPARDMEAILRRRHLKLFASESKDSLDEFDGIGFTLQSELTYTNVLNVIDLAGLPLRGAHRADRHPLVFAGGPAVFNPEPLAPFIDFFVIGDGEEVVVEIAEALRATRGRRRSEKLERLAGLAGVYVPAIFPAESLADGRLLPRLGPRRVVKRVAADLDASPFPAGTVVPFTQQVHDRASLEVLRGCTQGCRFCQAGMTTRPARERSVERIERLMDRTLEKTGYEEISLVSLSTCDHSRVRTLVDRLAARGEAQRVAVSLPSLLLDSFSVDLADRIAQVRRSGLTFAPEAASPRLRALINKWIPDDELLDMARESFRRGWNHVKLYFMIGLPTETDEDVEAIADLTLRTLAAGREVNPRARVHTGVSTFVPKPFTPLQWAAQIDRQETERRQAILRRHLGRHRGVHFGHHRPDETFIEGLISRGDRSAGDLLEAAWRHGARFDAWHEHRDLAAWEQALRETGFPAEAALAARPTTERLPWDHIDVLVSRDWLLDEWHRALAGDHAADCRHSKCHRCGVIDRQRELCATMLRGSIRGRCLEANRQATPRPVYAEPPAVQRLRFRVGRRGEVRFLAHLEVMTAWIRALRRAGAPLSHSQGFHAHARVNFSTANPVGEASEGDFMDVYLKEEVDPEALGRRLAESVPEGFSVLGVEGVPLEEPSLMSRVERLRYELVVRDRRAASLRVRQREILAAERLLVVRRGKRAGRKGPVITDIRPLIERLQVRDQAGGCAIDFVTVCRDGRLAKCREIVALLGLDAAGVLAVKKETGLGDGRAAASAETIAESSCSGDASALA